MMLNGDLKDRFVYLFPEHVLDPFSCILLVYQLLNEFSFDLRIICI